ncbi:hypothetical protein Tcan_01554, partial [Toxocara canis]
MKVTTSPSLTGAFSPPRSSQSTSFTSTSIPGRTVSLSINKFVLKSQQPLSSMRFSFMKHSRSDNKNESFAGTDTSCVLFCPNNASAPPQNSNFSCRTPISRYARDSGKRTATSTQDDSNNFETQA